MDVIMPQLGETVTEGTVTKWYKQVGDSIKVDETLFDVETDKVSTEIPSSVAGVIAEIRVAAGVTAKVGVTLAVIQESGGAVRAVTAGAAASAVPTPAPVIVATASSRNLPVANAAERLSPVVRRLVAEHGLDIARISGSGRDGRVTRDDVTAFITNSAAQPVSRATIFPTVVETAARLVPVPPTGAATGGNTLPLNAVRKRVAENMTKSWTTAPHVLQVVEADFYQIDQARHAAKDTWKQREGFSLTYLPFVVRALSVALAKFPKLNATYSGDSLKLAQRINIGIAVDLNFDGLMVPVVKDVPNKSLPQIAREINDLAQRARTGKLKPDDLTEGTYTLSNNGAFGTVITAPIINLPQVAILSTDSVRKKPVVIESPEGDSIGIRPVGVLAQSFDHRAVDGAYAGAFLAEVKRIIETRHWAQDLQA